MAKNVMNLLLFFSLVSIGYSCRSSSGSDYGSRPRLFNSCPRPKHASLTEESARIKYKGNDDFITCEWKIPESVQSNSYIVAIWFEELDLPKCYSSLKFPGTGYRCQADLNKFECWVYMSKTHNCNITKVEGIRPSNVACNKLMYWEDLNTTTTISYRTQTRNSTFQNQSFSIRYHPIKCAIATLNETNNKTKPSNEITTETYQPTETETVLISAVTGAVGFLLLVLIVTAIAWCHRRKKWMFSKNAQLQSQNNVNELPDNTIYKNYMKTTDEGGYEIPRNARQYQNLGTEGQYGNFIDDKVYEGTTTYN